MLGDQLSAHASAAFFGTYCASCHGAIPQQVNYNAAGNVAIITAANAARMGAGGTLAEHASIATYLNSIKHSNTPAPVAFNSPGTVWRATTGTSHKVRNT